MAELPVLFTEYTRQLMGEERFERYLHSFEEDAPVSIRLNPLKTEVRGKRLEVRGKRLEVRGYLCPLSIPN